MSDENKTSITLSEKIEQLIVKYHNSESENEALKREVDELKTQNKLKDEQIFELRMELESKTLETDELLGKIESVLGI